MRKREGGTERCGDGNDSNDDNGGGGDKDIENDEDEGRYCRSGCWRDMWVAIKMSISESLPKSYEKGTSLQHNPKTRKEVDRPKQIL
ncbi:Hypothetical predicted protein [Octopus vulgaris]|uniref:Uncharacterized protein n=1 Tax=Octopus vulgaris TaxID=6645 RepID=A0AA36BBV5_OCTVU|nr:Hypothetical predicted protein [Octopus vulgaris]